MDLKQLIIDTKSVWMEYPGKEGFEVEIANLSRQELIKLRKACTITRFDRATRIPVEDLDEEKFNKKFTEAVVKNWKGLTLDHLQTLVLIDTSGKDLSEELEYTKENAYLLVSGSSEFDAWLNGVVFDLDNFRDKRERESVGEAG